jgi:pimeloyl-ACP methyl ester carboxylesterase
VGRGVHSVAVLVAVWLTVACTAQPGSSPEETATPSARLLAGEPMAACTIKGEYPVKAEAPALCGTLRVPEDRSNPDGRQIGLRVAVVPAVATDPEPDPLFVVAGGPGDAGTQFFAWLPPVFEDVHATRDIILIDQRGTGDSNALKLPEMPDTSGLSQTDADAFLSAWADDALASIDADPRFYTTTVAADDVDDVRAALGYETIDLYGTSYGGTLAQYYLRQHGEHVHVAVLDGSTPVDVPVLERMAASSHAALDLLFQRCAEDTACYQAFPRLADEWAALMDRLATPLTIVDPESGAEAVIDRIMLADAIHAALLTESTAAQIPLAIHLAQKNQWLEAAEVISAPPSGGPTLLMADEIFCSEAWARFNPAEVARLGAGSYALERELAKAEERAAMCKYLPQAVVPADDAAAVHTDTPVLWLAGDGDPQDPPVNLAMVPVQEPNSRIVVMPAQQHVIGHLGCMPSVIAAFLEAGSANQLDTSCVAQGAPAPPFRLE